jgi:hypothetical protein
MKKLCLLIFFLVLNSAFSYGKIEYSFIFQIHEDASYDFHTKKGEKKFGHKEAYKQAKKLAVTCTSCEVFIFREMKKNISYSGKVEYFLNGKRKSRLYHKREQDEKDLEFFQKHSLNLKQKEQKIKTFFTYFGHSIPEATIEGYSHSLPHLKFGIKYLENRLGRLGAGGDSGYLFDGIILSSCHNGTPFILNRLVPFARYVIASPENLHLSYLDISPFLEIGKQKDTSTLKLLKKIIDTSMETFEQRAIKTFTVLSLYQIQEIKATLAEVSLLYEKNLTEITHFFSNYKDCQEVSEISPFLKKMSNYIYTKSNNPFFSTKPTQEHSGLSCIKPE